MRRLLFALIAAVFAAGCAGKKPVVPADQLWQEGNDAFHDEAYEYAIDRYKMLLDQHPFDEHAEEAELKIAQSYFAAHRYAEAVAAFGDFERMHPTSPNLPMVEYHLGLAYLAQASTSDRDQQQANNALTYFRNVIDRYPSSPWAERAQLRMTECRAQLAQHEADVAAYYLRHGNLAAAEARLGGMLTDYPETDATAESLHTFAAFYAKREEPEEAHLALATIARHHPYGPYGEDARQQLGGDPAGPDDPDPLPQLVARLQEMQAQSDRQKRPPNVSAYPNAPPGTPGPQQY